MSGEPREVVVFETADATELALARNLLEQEGIPCRVNSGGASAFLGAALGAQFQGFHELLVPAACEERAARALDAAWPDAAPDGPA